MTRHSPKTGRWISQKTFRRWYAPGAPNRKEYLNAKSRWKRRKRKLPPPPLPPPGGMVERIINLRSTRKARRGGRHDTLLDIRVMVPRDMPDKEILDRLRDHANQESLAKPLQLKFISWTHGSGKPREGKASDLPALGAIINNPEEMTVREEE